MIQKMISFDVIKENIKENNLNWPQIPDQLYKILTTEGSGSGKTDSFNLISQQPGNDKTYLYGKDPYKAKYQFLTRK